MMTWAETLRLARVVGWHGLEFAAIVAFVMAINDNPEADLLKDIILPAVLLEVALDLRRIRNLRLMEKGR